MGSVTGIYTSESGLHPAAHELLLEAIDQGWADPQKLHHPSRKLANLLESSKQSIAASLRISAEKLYFLGEPALGFHLGINGSLGNGVAYLPATARQEALACANAQAGSVSLKVDIDGNWEIPVGEPDDLLIHPTVNIETGAIAPSAERFQGSVFVDATASPFGDIPANWKSALWDAKSWRGPAGIGIFAIEDERVWRNPLPHLDYRKVPGTFSPALAIASALALEAHLKDRALSLSETIRMNERIRSFILSEIGDVDIASSSDSIPEMLSFSFLYINAEQLIAKMDKSGFNLDSGSACISANLEPSHVLSAMGRLTHGNVRLHLYPDLLDSELDSMLQALKENILDLRSQN